ncbi:MAG TPA: CcoQ/FixQ family Cbb3-type cytochrome c oxidase assembly chaperone [Methylophilaceae bacterium]|nr:CcoQ/FixQ family Cbb3-type cytochrome c oxidase assembly chaperone [Methylophilaceae bacterium]HAJ72557.1 CcoQ/FixQ family Cbb3-type cytochrome c oxidase assembly chaperone [Methylophilaceae bacterium]
MDINTLRILATVSSFILFVSIVIWAWKNRDSKNFKEAESLPFIED